MTVLRDYATEVGQPTLDTAPPRYDEVIGTDGSLRPAWRSIAASALEITGPQLRRVQRDIGRFLGDDGVTYRRPGEPGSRWRLDPLPLVLSPRDWSPLEVGLTQRAELLNALLADLHGPRSVLARGVLPPALVYAHQGFLRVAARPGTRDDRPLLLTGTDVARTPQGDWAVVADRTQAPSGLGYAMENRHVISRVLPQLYRDAGLHQIGPFVQAVRSTLMQAAPGHVDDPRVVVLTPGSSSETAFDQAHLASSLGFPLVQGSDLVVRSGAVWMRVFGRLERVDVVLRRVDAPWCDPLELRGDSQLGVPGLLEAVRRGSVRIVNGLGSGVLENPGLLPFMSALCEHLLDEPLRLPSVPTYWLGDGDALASVRHRLDELAVRSIDRSVDLDDLAGDALLARVEAEPHRFVAQELPTWSQAPGLAGGAVRPQPVALRAFTLRYGSSYRPMLGGLASVLDGSRSVSSKDVWVLKEAVDQPDQGLAEVMPVTSSSRTTPLVPRVLEDLFWFGRYAERAEDTLRLVLVAHALAEDFRARPYSAGGVALRVLREALLRLVPGPFEASVPESVDDDLRSVLLDADRPASVAHSFAALRSAAEGVRDQLSVDVFRAFGATERAAALLSTHDHSLQVTESAERMLTGLLALHGATASMVHDEGWETLEAGRSLERCLQVVALLRRAVTVRRGIDVDRHLHQGVLTATESAVTHRRRYRGFVRVTTLAELLLADRGNPRSLRFNLEALRAHVAALPASSGSTRPERLLDDLSEELDRVDIVGLVPIEGESRPNLERHLDTVTVHLSRFAEAFAAMHLATAPAPRSFGLAGRSPA
jgi:uncharacterized circularly permuted ATP-grasp superfamily protein/uncharacterized alpha-E superfamily protein